MVRETAELSGDRTGQRLVSTQTVQHDYLTLGGRVARETITTDGTVTAILDFIYDESGRPFALNYSADGGNSFTTYYYVLNLQGDVVKLISYIPGFEYEEVASYTYDAWGNIISATGEKAELNPLRYRGYYYDTETGFYYLQSRYYDPANHRFINADVYASTDSTDAISCNMFAYCENNPVMNSDPTGEFGFLVGLLVSAVVSAVVNVATTYVAAKVTGQEYTLTDGLVAAAAGVANAIPVVGKFVAGGISGGYAAYTAYKNGATPGEILLNASVAASATIFSIGNLSNLGTSSVSAIAVTATADVVFGTGFNCISAATNKAIAQNAAARTQATFANNKTTSSSVHSSQAGGAGGAVRCTVAIF